MRIYIETIGKWAQTQQSETITLMKVSVDGDVDVGFKPL